MFVKPFDCPNCSLDLTDTYERETGKYAHGSWFCETCEEEFFEEDYTHAD